MAGVAPRTILVCAFPAVLSLLTYLWIRKKKKNSSTTDYSNTNGIIRTRETSVEARTCVETLSEVVEDDQMVSEMHIKEQEQSRTDKINSMGGGNEITCSSSIDKIKDSGCSNVTNQLQQTYGKSETNIKCKVDSSSHEPIALRGNHIGCSGEHTEQNLSSSSVSDLPEKPSQRTSEIVPKCDEKGDAPHTENNAPDIVIESSLEESQVNGDFMLSDLKIFDEQELQTGVIIGSFGSVNYSEMDDLTDSPPHSTYSDVQSEGSSDSGKGGSDIQAGSDLSQITAGEDSVLIYEFELPQDLCGRLIGRMGKHVSFIKNRSRANVFIKKHLFNPSIKLCAVEGTQSEIKNALELIRKRFPLNQFPNVNLTQVNTPIPCGVMIPETLQLHLPEGVTCDVILSSMVSAGHFFVQQPTHPTYPSLNRLDQCMLVCYSHMETPELPQPVEVGVICSAPMMGGWYRASVVHVYENSEECDVKFVDYGGYSCTSISSLRQIRSDFMTLPFQASECYLANVKPPDDGAGWSLEACATFEELAQGQILQSLIVAHADDGVPYVHLYRIQGVSTVFINRELVNRGVAQWVEHQM